MLLRGSTTTPPRAPPAVRGSPPPDLVPRVPYRAAWFDVCCLSSLGRRPACPFPGILDCAFLLLFYYAFARTGGRSRGARRRSSPTRSRCENPSSFVSPQPPPGPLPLQVPRRRRRRPPCLSFRFITLDRRTRRVERVQHGRHSSISAVLHLRVCSLCFRACDGVHHAYIQCRTQVHFCGKYH